MSKPNPLIMVIQRICTHSCGNSYLLLSPYNVPHPNRKVLLSHTFYYLQDCYSDEKNFTFMYPSLVSFLFFIFYEFKTHPRCLHCMPTSAFLHRKQSRRKRISGNRPQRQ